MDSSIVVYRGRGRGRAVRGARSNYRVSRGITPQENINGDNFLNADLQSKFFD